MQRKASDSLSNFQDQPPNFWANNGYQSAFREIVRHTIWGNGQPDGLTGDRVRGFNLSSLAEESWRFNRIVSAPGIEFVTAHLDAVACRDERKHSTNQLSIAIELCASYRFSPLEDRSNLLQRHIPIFGQPLD